MDGKGRTPAAGVRAGIAILAASALLTACEGENLFRTPVTGPGGDAPRVEITRPTPLSGQPLNDSILVQADLRDNTGLDSVVFFGVSLRGDASLGQQSEVVRFEPRTALLNGVNDTTVVRFLLPAPDDVRDTAQIVALAYDPDGNVGTDTVRILLGGPAIDLILPVDGDQLPVGGALSLRASAEDPEGITDMDFVLVSAAGDSTIIAPDFTGTNPFSADTVVTDFPSTANARFEVTARATNALGIRGEDGPIAITFTNQAQNDNEPPQISLDVTADERLELTDPLIVQLTGRDNVGVAEAGYTVRAISATRGDTLLVSDAETYTPARTGTFSTQFEVPLAGVDPLALPDTMIYEVTGYFEDEAGNCAAAVSSSANPQQSSLECEQLGTGETVAVGQAGLRITVIIVAGQTVRLPVGGNIMDAAVDTARRRLFLSNMSRGQVEVFDLDNQEFGTAVGVGSEPWGLAMTRDGDSLWVANSGGTNFSVVDVSLASPREVENDRLFTPDVNLFEVERVETDTGIQYFWYFYPDGDEGSRSFSDRPQYVAVDAFGNVIYSTVTTATGELGTARKAFYPAGGLQSEVKLFVEHGDVEPTENFWSLAHIDAVDDDVSGLPALFDHVPGFPNNVISGNWDPFALPVPETPFAAAADLAAQGSDVFIESGRWDVPSIGFNDTTYVAGSGDGGFVLIGEGATAPVGRVLMYEAQPGGDTNLSGAIAVADFLSNASEKIRGVGVNYDGSMSGARGDFAYFFDEDLRELGRQAIPSPSLAQGLAFHPLHANAPANANPGGTYNPDTHLAFVGSGGRTIDIIDTQRFTRIGRVTIRDIIVGPLRAILPFPADNAGLTCASEAVQDRFGNPIGNAVRIYDGDDFLNPIPPGGATDDACVVVKLFGISSGGGVVVVPVRKVDILREHPVRVAN